MLKLSEPWQGAISSRARVQSYTAVEVLDPTRAKEPPAAVPAISGTRLMGEIEQRAFSSALPEARSPWYKL